jgi:hypothetical protein
VFKYHLNDEELDEIQLVLESGEEFLFPEEDVAVSTKEKKRDKK